ncbi:MAG TPA: choice-of-anchor D domain-containing protein, partial [Myxococcaceae bacterium]|nr:choice-of-anchor D domain-containing protein [Myxococcaceae bacterium]
SGAWALVLMGILCVPWTAQAFAPAFPPGADGTRTTWTQSSPTPIPDVSTVSTTINVSGLPSQAWDVDVQTFITHTWNADLYITVTSPQGTTVVLSGNNGGSADNVFNGTLWDDSASQPVTHNTFISGSVKGTLIPQGKMGAFIGENPNGTWRLTVSDQAGADVGTIHSWGVTIAAAYVLPSAVSTSYSNLSAQTISEGSTVISTITVNGVSPFLSGITLDTTLAHTSSGELVVRVQSPSGTSTALTLGNASGVQNAFNGTRWTDRSAQLVTRTSYTSGVAKTELAPEGALSAFLGEDPNGTWVITVQDNFGGGTGALNAWTLNLDTQCPGECTPKWRASATGLSYGGVTRGQTSSTQTFTIRNTGSGPLAVNQLTIAGIHADDFLLTTPSTFSVDAGSSATVGVAFRPVDSGPRSAELVIFTNDPYKPRGSVALTGRGDSPFNYCPAPITGSLAAGDATSGSRTFRDGSPGGCGGKAWPGTLAGGPFLYDTHAFFNSYDTARCVTVNVSGAAGCDIFSAVYAPTFVGMDTSTNYLSDSGVVPNTAEPVTLSFQASIPGRSPFVVVVNESSGTAGCGSYTVNVTGCNTPGQLAVTERALFGPAGIGSPVPAILHVANTGGAPVTITDLALSGSARPDYAITYAPSPMTIAPGATSQINLAFNPSLAGSRPALLTLSTTDSMNPSIRVELTGSGIAASASVGPDAVAFGSNPIGNRAVRVVAVGNPSLSNVVVKELRVSGSSNFTIVDPPTLPVTLSPEGSLAVKVAYLPRALADDAGSLQVVTDLTSNNTLSSALSGKGVQELALSPATLDFSKQALKGAREAYVTVRNLGAAEITLTAVQSSSAEFVVDASTVPAKLGPNAEARVRVLFQPTAVGSKTGTLTVNTSVRDNAASANIVGEATAAAGCGCGATGASGTLPLLLLLGGLLALRRRERLS